MVRVYCNNSEIHSFIFKSRAVAELTLHMLHVTPQASEHCTAVLGLGWEAVAQRCIPPSVWISRANDITTSSPSLPYPQLKGNSRVVAIVLFMKLNRLTTVKLMLSSRSALHSAVVWMFAPNPYAENLMPKMMVLRRWALWEVN